MKNFGIDLLASDVAEEMIKHFGVTSNNITQGFFMGICEAISQMRYYQEEGVHIEFRLAIGIENQDENLPRLYRLQQKVLPGCGTVSKEDIARDVYSIIKKVIPCCKENNDIYISLSLTTNEVNAGIYFLELNMIDQITHDFLDAGYMIAECVKENLVQLITDDKESNFPKVSLIKFDLNELNGNRKGLLANNCSDKSMMVRYWKGVFEQVKRCCHGTMCLVVEPDFDLSKAQEFFTKPLKAIEDITIIPNFFGENGSVESDHSLQIFFSMLNYDGITIIDTVGRIRSYNNICNNSMRGNSLPAGTVSMNCQSGSRHVAYDTMKSWNGDALKLVGLYFQSQEGEILFYNYRTRNQLDYFDASIMNVCFAKPFMDEAKKRYKNSKKNPASLKVMSQPEWDDYQAYISVVQELANTHIGIDNFYRECNAAEKLEKYFVQPQLRKLTVEQYTQEDKHEYTRKETLDAVLACIVGNVYGYAIAAQEVLVRILAAIPDEWIIEYFNGEYFLNTFMLQDLRSHKPYGRWTNTVVELLKSRNEKTVEICSRAIAKYTIDDFMNFYWCMSNFEIAPMLLGDMSVEE